MLTGNQGPQVFGVEPPIGGDDNGAAAVERRERHPVRGPVHERARREAAGAAGECLVADLFGRLDGPARKVATSEGAEEDVLVAPHHPLRHSGGAAGVQHVMIVRRSDGEVAAAARDGDRVLVVDRVEPGDVQAGAVFDGDEVRELGDEVLDRGELGRELAMEDHGLGVRIVEQIPELFLDVAVVDVHGHGADLERGEHALQVLDPVVQVERDVVARADAEIPEVVRQPVDPIVGLGVGEADVSLDQRFAVGNGVDDAFPEIGEVELHCDEPSDVPGEWST